MSGPVTELWGLTGPEFLGLFTLTYAISVLAVVLIRAVLLRTGARGVNSDVVLDAYQLAYLAGGPRRVVNTAIAQAVLSDCVLVGRSGKLTVVPGTIPRSEVEAAVIDGIERYGRWKAPRVLRKDPRILAIGDQLRGQGLLLSRSRVMLLKAATLLPLVVWCVGLLRAIDGSAEHHPIEILIAWLFITAVLTVYCMCLVAAGAAGRPSADGRRALQAARERYDTQKEASGKTTHGVQLVGVALIGFVALSDDDLRDSLIHYTGGGGGTTGSCGSGGSCGGGGCGGGGCGG